MKTTINLALMLFLAVLTLRGQNQEIYRISPDLVVTRLSPGCYMHTSYAVVDGFGRVPANGLVVVSGNKALLCDTPWNDELTSQLCNWMERELNALVRVALLTHSHEDCMGGIADLHRRGIRTWAHRLTRAIAKEQGLLLPRKVFDNGKVLSLAGRKIEFFYPGPGHTVDNVVAWIDDEKVLFGGCLVRSAGSRDLGNTAEADLSGWTTSIPAVLQRYPNAAIVVPGHGAKGGTELLVNTARLLEQSVRQERW